MRLRTLLLTLWLAPVAYGQESVVDCERCHANREFLTGKGGRGNPEADQALYVPRSRIEGTRHGRLVNAAAFDALQPDDREILVLVELEGQDVRQAAETLGLSLNAAKSRLHRARLRLVASAKQERS